MSISLNGTSQYVSLGDAVNVRSATPILIAIVIDSTSLPSATRGLYSQGDYSDNRGHGAFLYGGPPKNIGAYGAPAGSSTTELDGSVATVAADTGWVLICIAIYTTSTAPTIVMTAKTQTYRYDTTTWGTQEGLGNFGINLSTTSTQAPAATDTTVIGANQITTIGNFWPGRISWIAVFNNDGGAGTTQIKDTAIAAELIANGAWNLLDANCALFIPFRNAALDESGNGLNGTLVGSPTYSDAGPGELPASTQAPRSMHQYRLRHAV